MFWANLALTAQTAKIKLERVQQICDHFGQKILCGAYLETWIHWDTAAIPCCGYKPHVIEECLSWSFNTTYMASCFGTPESRCHNYGTVSQYYRTFQLSRFDSNCICTSCIYSLGIWLQMQRNTKKPVENCLHQRTAERNLIYKCTWGNLSRNQTFTSLKKLLRTVLPVINAPGRLFFQPPRKGGVYWRGVY